MTERKLILWDIDGTLIHSGAAGEQALVRAAETVLGIRLDLNEIDWAGRTDRRIAEMILEHFDRPADPEVVAALIDVYLNRLPEEVQARRGVVLPGINAVLERIEADPALFQGLLTGNMERGARAKLAHYDLWRYFPFGGFADDGVDRNELGPHALRKASEYCGRSFDADEVYVVGDTPHDIACGRVIGASTIAVATGKYSETALSEHNPAAVFGDLGDTEAFFRVLGVNCSSYR